MSLRILLKINVYSYNIDKFVMFFSAGNFPSPPCMSVTLLQHKHILQPNNDRKIAARAFCSVGYTKHLVILTAGLE